MWSYLHLAPDLLDVDVDVDVDVVVATGHIHGKNKHRSFLFRTSWLFYKPLLPEKSGSTVLFLLDFLRVDYQFFQNLEKMQMSHIRPPTVT